MRNYVTLPTHVSALQLLVLIGEVSIPTENTSEFTIKQQDMRKTHNITVQHMVAMSNDMTVGILIMSSGTDIHVYLLLLHPSREQNLSNKEVMKYVGQEWSATENTATVTRRVSRCACSACILYFEHYCLLLW